MRIKAADFKSIKPFLRKIHIPKKDSHKGQNGRILVIGGSSLFHNASLWAAQTASYFVDMVHYASTKENNKIVAKIKKEFRSGIVVSQDDIPFYVEEDDAVLVGPGMLRGDTDEAKFTSSLTETLIKNFPRKQFVFDAGAIQMMNANWLKILKRPAVVTPHQGEFQTLFGKDVRAFSLEKKTATVKETAARFRCIIALKAVVDIISDGVQTIVIEGGNAGLTKGGSGDVLAGIAVGLSAKTDAFTSAVSASILLKKTAERLFTERGYWYNTNDVIGSIPQTLLSLFQTNDIVL